VSAGAVRCSYIYELMAVPSLGTGAPQTSHIDDLAAVGINTVIVKMNQDTATPLQLAYWSALSAKAAAKNVTLIPVFNWHNATAQMTYRDPDRGYLTSAALGGVISPVIPCPNDPTYIRAQLTNFGQRLPGTTSVIFDREFPGSPGGFHSYAVACHCLPCRLDYYRSLNCPGGKCSVDPLTIVLPSDATLLAFQQTLHQSLVARYAAQAAWSQVALLDNDSADVFIHAAIAGLVAAGKTVRVFSELTYTSGGPASQSYPGATVIGGLWLEKWSPANLQTQITTMGATGYWIFTSYSFWLGQTVVDTTAAPYDLPLGTPGSSISQYYAALAAVNT